MRRRTAVITGIAALFAAGTATGIVHALWSTSGTGPGAGRAVTAQAITIAAAASPTADLYPGGTGALQFAITNPNPYSIQLTAVDYGTVSSSDAVNCPAANVTVAVDGALSTPIDVSAGASAAPASISGALTMLTSAPNGCQGVTFTVSVTLSGTQT